MSKSMEELLNFGNKNPTSGKETSIVIELSDDDEDMDMENQNLNPTHNCCIEDRQFLFHRSAVDE